MTQRLPRDELDTIGRRRSGTTVACVVLLVVSAVALLLGSLQVVVIVVVTLLISLKRAIVRYRALGRIADLLNCLNSADRR
jgi:Flp pilus assembly protein TadB